MSEDRQRTQVDSLDEWGERLVAAKRPSKRLSGSAGKRFAASLAVASVMVAAVAGIAAAADAGPFADDPYPEELSGIVPRDSAPIVPTGQEERFSCPAFDEWARNVYVPWWNERMRSGQGLTPEDDAEIPVPPADICQK